MYLGAFGFGLLQGFKWVTFGVHVPSYTVPLKLPSRSSLASLTKAQEGGGGGRAESIV